MPDFERTVLERLEVLDEINTRLGAIELRVQGAVGDPNNQGIAGKLKAVDTELVDINKRQRRLTDDVRFVKEGQKVQGAWMKGMAAGLLVTGGTGIVTVARMFGVG